MAWAKSSPRLIAAFDALVPGAPAERKRMFGYPAAFVNKQLFMGLWQEELMLRLPEEERAAMGRIGGKAFEPMPGRPMREYVSVPPDMIYDVQRLKPWVEKALAFARSLTPKTTSKKKAATASTTMAAKGAKRAAAAGKTAKAKTAKVKATAEKLSNATIRRPSKAKPGAAKRKTNSRSRARPRKAR